MERGKFIGSAKIAGKALIAAVKKVGKKVGIKQFHICQLPRLLLKNI